MLINEGDVVVLDGFGVCSIVSTADPSLVTVRLPSGTCIRIGERAVCELMKENDDKVTT